MGRRNSRKDAKEEKDLTQRRKDAKEEEKRKRQKKHSAAWPEPSQSWLAIR
jgi:hypothetical protein